MSQLVLSPLAAHGNEARARIVCLNPALSLSHELLHRSSILINFFHNVVNVSLINFLLIFGVVSESVKRVIYLNCRSLCQLILGLYFTRTLLFLDHEEVLGNYGQELGFCQHAYDYANK